MSDSIVSGKGSAIPVAPSMEPTLKSAGNLQQLQPGGSLDARAAALCVLCAALGIIAGYAAQGLVRLIYFFTNLSFFARVSIHPAVAAQNHLGWKVIFPPVVGALVVGLMARFGSRAVAGHGIPEAMEQVLTNQSRIPVRLTFLKPLSAAVSIGTGGPYGAEGPIIATGGALGSLIGQLLPTTGWERKTLLAAGAGAGIAALFGCPLAAILLAIELLLFEFRPRSILPVAFAAAAATAVHIQMEGTEAIFPFTGAVIAAPDVAALLGYTLLGVLLGFAALGLTRAVTVVEHAFAHMPIHWMLQPAIGAIAVGIIGFISPRTLGPGYFNLHDLLAGKLVLTAAATLCLLKFLSWTISLGSGTAGGTLAPVFTIGGALAVVVAILVSHVAPQLLPDVRVAAVVGMVGIFAGASRAMLTSIVFALETTHEPGIALPVILGCGAAYMVAALISRHSIMTDKMARSGVRVPADYSADHLSQILVSDILTGEVVTLDGEQTVAEVTAWLRTATSAARHQGYPVLDAGRVAGVLTRRDLLNDTNAPNQRLRELIHREPVTLFSDETVREAVDLMATHDIGRVPVVGRTSGKLVGIVTRGDVLGAHRQRLVESSAADVTVRLWPARPKRNDSRAS